MISIIVPVFNEELHVVECLKTIIKQMTVKDELIIIDDGSTDNSAKLISETVSMSGKKNIKFISTENKGLGSACNRGLEESTQDFVLFVDSDDYLADNQLSILREEITLEFHDIYVFDIENVIDGISEKIPINLPRNKTITLSSFPELLLTPPSAKNKLFNRHIFLDYNIRFPEKLWFEDLLTVTKLYIHAEKIKYLDEGKYLYIHREHSIINNANLEKNQDIIIVFENICDYYIKNKKFLEFSKYLHSLLDIHVLINTSNRLINNSSTLPIVELDKVNEGYKILHKNYEFKKIKSILSPKQKALKILFRKRCYRFISFLK